MGKSIGIDLGTTNSVVAFKDTMVKIINNKEDLGQLTRSCVAFPDLEGEPLVGNKAYDRLHSYSPNAVFSIKRLMGGSITDPGVIKMKSDSDNYPFQITNLSSGTNDAVAIVIHGKEFTPEDISSIILKRLKDDASSELGEISHAVITVPAYFNEKQRTATRLAAHMAGLKVQRLISEPTAAAISYGIDNIKEGESKVVLIYDFGGGTFDLSILVISGVDHIEAVTGGDRWLGGDDIDRLLMESVLEEICKKNKKSSLDELTKNLSERKKAKFKDEFRKQVEAAKKQLTVRQTAKIELYDYLEMENGDPLDIVVTVTKEKFEAIILPLVERTINLIDDLLEKNGYPIETIDNILLVGGSSGIPLVIEMLAKKYGSDKVVFSNEPMLAIAKGAAILAHSLKEEFECPNCGVNVNISMKICDKCKTSLENSTNNTKKKIDITHSTKHGYFIQTLDINGKTKLENIIDNASVLPLKVNKIFKTTVDNQKIVEIIIYANAENGTYDKQTIGYYTIKENIPKNSQLTFSFSMDKDETMSISVCPAEQINSSDIVLGRGNKDSKCLEKMSDCIKNIFSSEEISEFKKTEFMEKVQGLIEEINNLGNTKHDSPKWYEIQSKLERANNEASSPEDLSWLSVIFAQILLDVYEQFIDNTDKNALLNLTNRYKNAANDLQKQQLLQELQEITDNYQILMGVFFLQKAASQSNDAAKATRLMNYHSSAMGAIQNGDFSAVVTILNNAFPLLQEVKIDWGTGVGSN